MGSQASTIIRADGDAIVTATHGLRGTYDLLIFQRPQYLDFTKVSTCWLIVVPRRQIFCLMAHSSDQPRIWCDAVLVDKLKSYAALVGYQTSAAVCLSRKKEDSGLDAPQYEYKHRCAIIHALDEGEEPVDWDSTPGSKSWEKLQEITDTNILCDVSEGQTIYLT